MKLKILRKLQRNEARKCKEETAKLRKMSPISIFHLARINFLITPCSFIVSLWKRPSNITSMSFPLGSCLVHYSLQLLRPFRVPSRQYANGRSLRHAASSRCRKDSVQCDKVARSRFLKGRTRSAVIDRCWFSQRVDILVYSVCQD